MKATVAQIETVIAGGAVRIPVVAWGTGWLMMEKPCGMSIHNDPGHDLCSVALSAMKAGQLPGAGHDLSSFHAVHRLDRDTSGIVLLAGDSKTLAFFGRQFAARDVHKRYLALVHGCCSGSADRQDWASWSWPLTAGAAGRNHPAGKGKRMPCVTRWRPLAHSLHYSLIECLPLTGRKHQIRRHAKLAGNPIVGDRRYGSGRSREYLRRNHDFDRLGLHSHLLIIRLPGESQATTFKSGGLPEAMRRLLEADR